MLTKLTHPDLIDLSLQLEDARAEYNAALAALDEADPRYIDVVIHRINAAESRVKALRDEIDEAREAVE